MSGSRAACIAKETGKILGRAALMRNPVTAVFYGEFNKIRNDYVRAEEFKYGKHQMKDGSIVEGRSVLHPEWSRENQNT